MTTRALSTPVSPNAAQISNRETYARTQNFVLRDWTSGLAQDFGDDLYKLVFQWNALLWNSYRDWAKHQVEKAHELNRQPPKLLIKHVCAPPWLRTHKFSPIKVPAIHLSAGDFCLPLYAITLGNGEVADLDLCRDALDRAKD